MLYFASFCLRLLFICLRLLNFGFVWLSGPFDFAVPIATSTVVFAGAFHQDTAGSRLYRVNLLPTFRATEPGLSVDGFNHRPLPLRPLALGR